MTATASSIISALRQHRFRLGDEKRLQTEIAACLSNANISFAREVRLDGKNRIDFLADRIGIEIKIKGGRMDIYRQLQRYAAFDGIGELILITNAAMGLPSEIGSKPIYYVSLGAGWL